ncbi:ead/Ea22-like family protein [Raoultella ornithinolytica]|uniref:ead/Ea22-like family protein n=1 Tax=Raoultella ornithinolytica TaxID=54291 RepID=UPI001E570200|nr:ead/Ea22-like family protein [Raoultella ornithinolytica]
MTTDITELALSLKAAAEEATPGGWCIDDYHGVIADAGLNGNYYIASCSGPDHRSNKRFIALANPANVLALVEALEKAQAKNALVAGGIEAATKLHERIAELESEVKFPGVMRCNKCGFSRSHVIATPGGMRAGESTPARCPNGCGPLWHDTYRRQYNELYDAYKELESRTVTVKLPKPISVLHRREFTEAHCAIYAYPEAEVNAALDDSGIKWEAE